MCGIAAMIGETASSADMKTMLELMHHRGPDEDDILSKGNTLLGHKRLSIISPENGIQPISNENRDVSIICNGEIYNYKEVRERHLSNHQIQSLSDSEVPLHLYEEYGVDALQYIEGMFAFIITDYRFETPKLLAARDPLGIKPLYYGEKDGVMFIASEMKCLFDVVEEIREFPAGHYYTPEEGFVSFRSIESSQPESPSDHQQLDEVTSILRRKLERAVQKRLMSDVPLGVFLSGGLDSSLIAGIANKLRSGSDLKSFSVGFKGSHDLIAAREVAEMLGTQHYEYVYTEDELWEAIPKVIYHLESFEPSLVRSAIPNYFVSQLAAQHVKVILSGEGADELFSGYEYLKEIDDLEQLHQELVRTLKSLHNINLQRLDRMTMAHSLEGRVPFLDEELINYALKIPAEWKLREDQGKKTEKWILRKAFDGANLIPDSVLWRVKEEFSEGSGAKDILEQRLEKEIPDEKWETECSRILSEDGVEIRSKMELYFYSIFREYFPHLSALDVVGRWATV